MGGLAGSGIALQREAGVLQVTLYYPANAGPGASVAQAEILRARFPRGLVLTSGSVRVTVERAPSIAPAFNDGGFYGTPLSIPFRADVFS